MAFLAGPSPGLPYFLPSCRMDAIKKHVRSFFVTAYRHDQAQPRYRRASFHLGWAFDAAMVIALLIVVVGYLTA